VKKCRGYLTTILRNYKKRVIPAKAGIQGLYTTPLRTYWIPAFAGMTLLLHLFTSSESTSSTESILGVKSEKDAP